MRKRANSPFFCCNMTQTPDIPPEDTGDGPGTALIVSSSGNDRQVVLTVWELVAPLCTEAGLELVYVEYQAEPGGRVLRLYVDRSEGVRLADCETVSRQAGDLLDVHLDVPQSYRLEVSSPGVERPLGRRVDFIRHSGRPVQIRTHGAIDGQKRFSGRLRGLEADRILVEGAGQVHSIPLTAVRRANLIASWPADR